MIDIDVYDTKEQQTLKSYSKSKEHSIYLQEQLFIRSKKFKQNLKEHQEHHQHFRFIQKKNQLIKDLLCFSSYYSMSNFTP